MALQATAPALATPFAGDDERWRAVIDRDARADGAFFYSVTTTGVFCRPSCGARRARRENVRFHTTAAQAEREGFRPCKRCRPSASAAHPGHAAAVARACALLENPGEGPDLAALAEAVGMSPSHFHRVFKSLTGLTPKAYALAERSRRLRSALPRRGTVASAIYEAGFGSSGRFYASATGALGMTPAEFRGGGAGVRILFAVGECSLGSVLVAATRRGVCSITLGDDPNALVEDLQRRFPSAELTGGDRAFEGVVARVVAFVEEPSAGLGLPLEVRGTAFQHRVWRKLREIPCGETRSYAEIAQELGEPAAARAVAHACAANPVAVAIPCHRVVRTDRSLSGYRWGVERKANLLARERTAAP